MSSPLQNNITNLQELLNTVNSLPEAGGTGGGQYISDAVLYTPQSLTEEQKAQARENIGAVTLEEVLSTLPIGEGVKF